jgi:branched-subunit amino acid transport protein
MNPTLIAVVALAIGTYAFRLGGVLLRHRLRLPARVREAVPLAAVALLTALAATAALTEGGGFAGVARPAGVLAGLLAASVGWRAPARGAPTRAQPPEAAPRGAEPAEAGTDRTGPPEAAQRRAEPSQTESSQAKSRQAESSLAEPSQARPTEAEPAAQDAPLRRLPFIAVVAIAAGTAALLRLAGVS